MQTFVAFMQQVVSESDIRAAKLLQGAEKVKPRAAIYSELENSLLASQTEYEV